MKRKYFLYLIALCLATMLNITTISGYVEHRNEHHIYYSPEFSLHSIFPNNEFRVLVIPDIAIYEQFLAGNVNYELKVFHLDYIHLYIHPETDVFSPILSIISDMNASIVRPDFPARPCIAPTF